MSLLMSYEGSFGGMGPHLDRRDHSPLWPVLRKLNLTDFYSSELQFLDLSERGQQELLETLPQIQFLLYTLKSLLLNNNNLERIPAAILSLSQLRMLFIAQNSISSLEGVGRLAALGHLNVEGNLLESLPEEIGRLGELKCLYLHENQLQELPEGIGGCEQLEVLFASNNRLSGLPQGLSKCTRLEGVNLKGNRITSFPLPLLECGHIRRLYLANNSLHVLPHEIGALAQLQILDLANNQLESLPDSIEQLTRLELLHCEHNLLTHLPESIGECRDLERLLLQGNRLSSLPPTLSNLKHLRELNVSHNQLAFLPAPMLSLLERLVDADISSNLYVYAEPSQVVSCVDPPTLVDVCSRAVMTHGPAGWQCHVPSELYHRTCMALACDRCSRPRFPDTHVNIVTPRRVPLNFGSSLPTFVPFLFSVCAGPCAMATVRESYDMIG